MTNHLSENKSLITKTWAFRIVITMGVIVLSWIIIARSLGTQSIVARVMDSSHKAIAFSTGLVNMALGINDAEKLYQDAVTHLIGDGVPKDSDKALRLYHQAADMGHPQAQEDLGLIYYTGYKVKRNYVEAIKWYKEAALQGQIKSAYELSIMYCRGEGTPIDDSEGAKWKLVAAEAGSAEAQWGLALMYGRGDGVPQDKEIARQWIRRAADQGYGSAEKILLPEQKDFLEFIFRNSGRPKSNETTAKAD